MMDKLNDIQLEQLGEVLDIVLYDYHIEEKSHDLAIVDTQRDILLRNFLGSKAIEGCSKATLKHYGETIKRMLDDTTMIYVTMDNSEVERVHKSLIA